MSRPPSPSDAVRAQLADRRSRAYRVAFSLPRDWLLVLLTLLIEGSLPAVEAALAEVEAQLAADAESGQ